MVSEFDARTSFETADSFDRPQKPSDVRYARYLETLIEFSRSVEIRNDTAYRCLMVDLQFWREVKILRQIAYKFVPIIQTMIKNRFARCAR